MSKKQDKLYHIFQVYGGELSSNTNLKFNEFISILSEKFEDLDYDNFSYNNIYGALLEYELEEDLYAGDDDLVWELYFSNDKGELISTNYTKYLKDIAKFIFNNYE